MKASYVKILPCGSTVHSDHTEPCVDFVQEPIDREAYERDLRRRQDEHLKERRQLEAVPARRLRAVPRHRQETRRHTVHPHDLVPVP